jgi:ribose/xylose/arabinose/galactoside ABC-type transport system permease subunit|nr:ABC transporter permease [uncultured Oscillibacter sp.]
MITMKSVQSRRKQIINGLGVWLILIGLLIVLSLTIGPDVFFGVNLINVIRQICVVGVMAVGATFVILCGEIDLSAGAMAALSGCASAFLIVNLGFGVWTSIILTIIVGMVFGLIMGAAVTYLRVESFIATLGMQYILTGIVMLITNGSPILNLPDAYLIIGRGYVLDVIPVPTIILLVLVILMAFVQRYTKFGRDVMAVGENRVAARLSGINVIQTKLIVFALAGGISALSGIMLASRLSSGQPTAAGDLSLQALAAVYVGGGTAAAGTQNGVIGTLAGALIIGFINNGMNLLEINAYWQKVVLGAVIIAAVALDAYRSYAGKKN